MKKTLLRAAWILAALFFWIGLWWLLSEKIGLEFVLPSPLSVAKRLWELLGTKEFYETVLFSFLRILSGFAAGVILGTVFAFAAAKIRPVEALISPAMTVIRATPVASFIIVVILLMDKEFVSSFICFLMVLPIVYQNVVLGIRKIDPALLEMAKVFRVPKKEKLKKIEIPSVLPFFLSSVKLAIGLAWKAGVAAEVLSLPKISIGKRIFEAKNLLESADVYAWTVAIILISVAFEKMFSLFWKKREAKNAEN